MKAAIIAGRLKVKGEKLDTIMDQGFYTATKAQEAGLIDEIAYMPDVENQLTAQGFTAPGWKIAAHEYSRTRFYDDTWGNKPTIAVLVLGLNFVGDGLRDRMSPRG